MKEFGKEIPQLWEKLAFRNVIWVRIKKKIKDTVYTLHLLKTTKTPFVVAVNKIDKIHGWKSNDSFLENVKEQSELTMESFDKYFYNVVAQFSNQGFSSDRCRRVKKLCPSFNRGWRTFRLFDKRSHGNRFRHG